MNTTAKSKVIAKIFLGVPISSEIRMYLKESKPWKQAQVHRAQDSKDLIEVHFENKNYIGKFLSTDETTLEELRKMQHEIRSLLHLYCPEIPPEAFKIVTFPQVFIS